MQNVLISDTSCLVILSKINKLHLLNQLFGKILITPEIADEYGKFLPEWIEIRNPKDKISQKIINASLDLGEASVIALAMEFENPLLILDDLKARNFAESINLPYTGTMGVLLDAKKNSFMSSLKNILEQIDQTDFRISEALIDHVLKLGGEK
jgi:predicted nucleic acid-binding protein